MKKIFTLFVGVIVCTFANSAHANAVVEFDQLNTEIFSDLFIGKLPPVIIPCPAGTKVPIQLIVTGDLLHLESEGSNKLYLSVQRDFFVKTSKDDLLFSLDLIHWETVTDFATGNISAKLDTKKGTPCVVIKAKINHKE